MPAEGLGWLVDQHVPLWAFVLALLTTPARWSARATDRLDQLWSGGGAST